MINKKIVHCKATHEKIMSETVDTLSYQLLYFLELYGIIKCRSHDPDAFVPLNTPMDIVSLYGDFANDAHYKDFLYDLKSLEKEFQERFRFIKLAGSSDYLHEK